MADQRVDRLRRVRLAARALTLEMVAGSRASAVSSHAPLCGAERLAVDLGRDLERRPRPRSQRRKRACRSARRPACGCPRCGRARRRTACRAPTARAAHRARRRDRANRGTPAPGRASSRSRRTARSGRARGRQRSAAAARPETGRRATARARASRRRSRSPRSVSISTPCDQLPVGLDHARDPRRDVLDALGVAR